MGRPPPPPPPLFWVVPLVVPPPPSPQPPEEPWTDLLPPYPRRFCEVEFQGPLSIQEEWVRHLQRHILEMNFSKADPLRGDAPAPEPPAVAEAQ